MKNEFIRLSELELTNFKNVSYGKIIFTSNNIPEVFSNSSITGIYGQNGSGKTAAINALELLKKTLTSKKLDKNDSYNIKATADFCKCKYTFLVTSPNLLSYKLSYELTLKRKSNDSDSDSISPFYFAEKIQYKSFEDDSSLITLLNYTYEKPMVLFGPGEQLSLFVNRSNKEEFAFQKRLTKENSSSYFFSRRFLSLIGNINSEKPVKKVLSVLLRYGFEKLFVIPNSHSGLISLNMGIPLSFSHEDSGIKAIGEILMSNQSKLPLPAYETAKKVLLSLNGLLTTLVPELQLDIKEYGIDTDKNNQEWMKFELLSIRNETKIPLKFESEGIRKIISILDLLVCMYNNEDITVVIDELDAGVFEYLLGELISVLKDNAKGQLIFTSHNLRPLEVLDYSSVYFTTTNNENKYIKFKNVREWNNLRDMFIRAITIGGYDEILYQQTDKSDIRRAFRKIKQD